MFCLPKNCLIIKKIKSFENNKNVDISYINFSQFYPLYKTYPTLHIIYGAMTVSFTSDFIKACMKVLYDYKVTLNNKIFSGFY